MGYRFFVPLGLPPTPGLSPSLGLPPSLPLDYILLLDCLLLLQPPPSGHSYLFFLSDYPFPFPWTTSFYWTTSSCGCLHRLAIANPSFGLLPSVPLRCLLLEYIRLLLCGLFFVWIFDIFGFISYALPTAGSSGPSGISPGIKYILPSAECLFKTNLHTLFLKKRPLYTGRLKKIYDPDLQGIISLSWYMASQTQTWVHIRSQQFANGVIYICFIDFGFCLSVKSLKNYTRHFHLSNSWCLIQ